MRHFLSRSTLFLSLIACLFIVPACDSGGSNGDGGSSGGGGGGSGGDDVVQASDENSFDFSFTPPSSSASKDTETVQGFAFSWSGSTPDGNEAYAIYFSDQQTFDPDAVSSSSRPSIAGVLIVQGDQNPSGTFPIANFESGGDLSTDQAGGLIVKGFDQPEEQGTRTIQFFTGGSLEFSDGDVTGFSDVTATELFVDYSEEDIQDQFTNTENVSVSLNGTIDPAAGVSQYVDDGSFRITTSTN